MKGKNDKICLEQYLDFFHSGKQIDVTVNFLSQIISMHGFKKLQLPKKALIEAVDTLDLVNLSRSTLRDKGVSSCAFIHLENIIADLNELNWQDCCITSFQTLNFSSNLQSSADLSLITNSISTTDGSVTGRGALQLRRKRKKGPGSNVNGVFGSSSSGLVSFESS